MKFSKIAIATLVASVVLVGCGEDKTPDQVKFEQEKEMLAMKLAHEREMARIETSKVKAEHPESHTYVTENHNSYPESDVDTSYQPTYESSDMYEHQEQSSQVAPQTSQTYSAAAPEQGASVPQQAAQSEDSGFGAGSMLLAAAGGALAGYAVGEMLDNGMRSYQDDNGNTHYTDKNGKPVSKAVYEEKRKTSKVTKFKEKVKAGATKTKELAKKGVDKTKQTYNNVKSNEKVQNAVSKTKAVAKSGAEKAKTTYGNVKAKAAPKVQSAVKATKYQARKAKVVAKKAARKTQRAARKAGRRR